MGISISKGSAFPSRQQRTSGSFQGISVLFQGSSWGQTWWKTYLKVNWISKGSAGPSGQQRTSGFFRGTSVTEDDADPDSKEGRKPVPSVCTSAADSSKQTQKPAQAGCHHKNIRPTYFLQIFPGHYCALCMKADQILCNK